MNDRTVKGTFANVEFLKTITETGFDSDGHVPVEA
jgi:hypothetical protein